MSLRKRIADSARVNAFVEGVFARYISFSVRTSRWDKVGFETLAETLKTGEPVIFCIWHQRMMLAPWMFDQTLGKFCSLTSSARAGRMVGQILARFGFDTVPMSSHKRHVALSRDVLRRMNDGYSIGIAVDGPRGPHRIASTVPLQWARSSGHKVFVFSYSCKRAIFLPLWDRNMLPLPFTRGMLVCEAFDQTVPRKADAATTEALRQSLEDHLNRLTDTADITVRGKTDRT